MDDSRLKKLVSQAVGLALSARQAELGGDHRQAAALRRQFDTLWDEILRPAGALEAAELRRLRALAPATGGGEQ